MVKLHKSRGYVNYGDVNPREHGGTFIKDEGDSLRIVSVENVADSCSQLARERGRYLLVTRYVDKADLLADSGLNSYSGGDDNRDMFDSDDEFTQDKLIRLATACTSYRHGDDTEFGNNFYALLRRYGVRRWN